MTSSGREFEGQVAIVTGAGEGIGAEIVRALARSGARVLINDIDEAKAKTVAESISAEGGACSATGGDVGDVAIVRGLVERAVSTYGRLDIAVANAGITLWSDFFKYEPDDFYRVLSVNLGGSFFLAQAAARHMRDQGQGGRILLMSSVTGSRALQYLSAYSMTKAALEMLARQLVVELSPYQITVNAIAPGATVTPRNLADDSDYEAVWSRVTPTGRPATVADIARAALFLLSPGADQITGQTITVDGGWTGISRTPSLDFVENNKASDKNTGG
jgi:3-oxoacyl-[acyl-carrier protein] reductase